MRRASLTSVRVSGSFWPADREGARSADGAVAGPKRVWAVVLIMAVSVAAGLSGCATVPRFEPRSAAQLLPSGSPVYLALKISKDSPLVAGAAGAKAVGSSDGQLARMLHLSTAIVASLDSIPAQGSEPGFSAVALGNFPAGYLGWQALVSPDWHRSGKGTRYWVSASTGVSFLATGHMVVATTGSLDGMLARASDGVTSEFGNVVQQMPADADGLLLLTDPSLLWRATPPGVAAIAENAHLPVTRVVVLFRRSGVGYTGVAELFFDTEQAARVASVIVRLFVMQARGTTQMGFSWSSDAAVSLDGVQMRVTGIYLSAARILDSLGSVIGEYMTAPKENG